MFILGIEPSESVRKANSSDYIHAAEPSAHSSDHFGEQPIIQQQINDADESTLSSSFLTPTSTTEQDHDSSFHRANTSYIRSIEDENKNDNDPRS